MSAEPFKTLKSAATFEVVEKKSRFAAYAAPVESEEAARGVLARIRAENKEARHNVFAYVIGQNPGVTRFSDDGEPSGTGGAPTLAAVKNAGAINAVVVVTRYFGGILLGAAGLTRAYGSAATGAVNAAGTVERRPFRRVTARLDYAAAEKARRELDAAGFVIEDIGYAGNVELAILSEPERVAALAALLAEASAGRAAVEAGETVML